MNMYGYEIISESDLTHHGIKGQKWGVRRFQNQDGSLTAAGRKRQARDDYKAEKKRIRDLHKTVDAKYDKKDADAVFGTGKGGVVNRAQGHIKNEYERQKAHNKLNQEALNAKREYRQKLGKKKVDTIFMKMGQKNIDTISEQSLSEFTRDYISDMVQDMADEISWNNERSRF